VTSIQRVLIRNSRCRAADVERAHRRLRARLANRLGGVTDDKNDYQRFLAVGLPTVRYAAPRSAAQLSGRTEADID
jgi:hypothetical protein